VQWIVPSILLHSHRHWFASHRDMSYYLSCNWFSGDQEDKKVTVLLSHAVSSKLAYPCLNIIYVSCRQGRWRLHTLRIPQKHKKDIIWDVLKAVPNSLRPTSIIYFGIQTSIIHQFSLPQVVVSPSLSQSFHVPISLALMQNWNTVHAHVGLLLKF